MKKLTVLYDARCGFCQTCRRWLENQPAFLRIECLPAQSQAAGLRYPELVTPGVPAELIVVSDEGAVYRGADAWIMCLYALKDYRSWARRLAHPALRPFAREGFQILSKNRETISRMLWNGWEHDLRKSWKAGVPFAALLDEPAKPPATPPPGLAAIHDRGSALPPGAADPSHAQDPARKAQSG